MSSSQPGASRREQTIPQVVDRQRPPRRYPLTTCCSVGSCPLTNMGVRARLSLSEHRASAVTGASCAHCGHRQWRCFDFDSSHQDVPLGCIAEPPSVNTVPEALTKGASAVIGWKGTVGVPPRRVAPAFPGAEDSRKTESSCSRVHLRLKSRNLAENSKLQWRR